MKEGDERLCPGGKGVRGSCLSSASDKQLPASPAAAGGRELREQAAGDIVDSTSVSLASVMDN